MRQDQRGGEGSLNIQGRGDVTVNVGVTVADLAAIASTLARDNLAAMAGIAKEVVDERLEHFVDKFVATVSVRAPHSLAATADPDFQYDLLAAERSYSRRGGEGLADTLVDLLVARMESAPGSASALALNAAIETVGLVSPAQLNALTCYWLVARVQGSPIQTREEFAEWLRRNLVPFVNDLPHHNSAYEHLSYARCAEVGVAVVDLGHAWAATHPGLFSWGQPRNEIIPELRDVPGVFVPVERDPQRVRVDAIHPGEVDALAESAGVSEHADKLRSILENSLLAGELVVETVLELVPELEPLVDRFSKTEIGSIRLTSVGIALAHANWSRVVDGASTPLAIWLPDETLGAAEPRS